MFCEHLASLPTTEALAQTNILERFECETPQVVYIVHCHACGSTHSIEFAIDDEPSFLTRRIMQAA